jgi:hypothetical protein
MTATLTPNEWATAQLTTQLDKFGAQSAIELRRWFVQRVVLSDQNQQILRTLEVPDSLLTLTQGDAPSPEHAGIASRLVYQYMDRPDLVLNSLPQISDPKSWNNSAQMTDLLLWAFEPWMTFRYDPKSETVFSALSNGQWVGHLKGKESDNYIIVRVQNYIRDLQRIGFGALLQALNDQGLVSTEIPNGTDPNDFALCLQASQHSFGKFCSRVSAVKEVVEQFQRLPIMFFDTGTLNTGQGLVAVGNGAVPTQDIHDDGPEGDVMVHPAGRLISAHPEYLLYSSAGLVWPKDETFEQFLSFRQAIHTGETNDSWSDWMDGARQYQDIILRRYCPTYLSFLEHAFRSEDDEAPTERDAFLRLLGAAVFGTNMKLVGAMIGAPNTGKDTVIKWLGYILGDQVGALSRSALTETGDDQRLFAPLKGARIAIVTGEVGEGRNSALLAEKIKSITSGGGLLTVAEKYEKPTTIFFDGMLVIQGNSVPTISGGDKALYRNRLVAVEFKHAFPLIAPNYEADYKKELPHFMQVLFLSYLDYQERGGGMVGVSPPASWQDFGMEVEASADGLSVIDRCLTEPDPAIRIPSTHFYRALSILAERNLNYPYKLSAQRWAKRLRAAGVDLSRSPKSKHRSRVVSKEMNGWVMHFTLNAEHSDGFFTQSDWDSALRDAAVYA